jgi:hypothetical protein
LSRRRRFCAELLDRADYLLTLARLTVLDWRAPMPETPTDRAIRDEGERIRKAFPEIDFNHPKPTRRDDLRPEHLAGPANCCAAITVPTPRLKPPACKT